jgi:hypothetical protein
MGSLRSELEHILTDTYLDGVADKSLEEIRAMRSECQGAEVALSYLRRVTQGRLDIVHAYLARAGGDQPDLAGVVDDLADILSAGPGRPEGPGRLPMLLAPDMALGDLTAEVDAVLDGDEVADLAGRPAEDLRALVGELAAVETRVSAERRALHERIDTLQAELVARYKSGAASVEGLLS